MRSSGFGGVTQGNNCNVNGSKPAFWNMVSDADLHRQSNLGNEEAPIDHDTRTIQSSFDMTSISQAKQSQQKSGKTGRSNGNCSKRSRVAHMEASLNLTGSVDMNVSPVELGSSYPGNCSISEKIQISKQKTVSVRRSEKRNGKISKSKSDSFSLKAGLSSFSSAAGRSNIFGLYGSKQDIYDVTKHVNEFSLNELLDGTYKCPRSIKKTENLNANVLHLVREACSVLQLRKLTHPQNLAVVDNTYHQNIATSGPSRSDDNKGDSVDPSSCNKVDDSCSGLINLPNMLEFPSFAPKDIMDRLALSPHNNLDLLLLGSTKPVSKNTLDPRSGKQVHTRNGLPTFPWSQISSHFKNNPDAKLTSNKITCLGKWIKMQNSTTFFAKTATYLANLESLTYDPSLVPLESRQPDLPSVTNMTFEKAATPSIQDGLSPGVLAAAQTLCQIAAHFPKADLHTIIRWPKRPSQKSMRATKLKSDEQLEKALFTIPISTTNIENYADVAMISVAKRLDQPEAKHVTQSPKRLSNKPRKLRKLVPMERRSSTDIKRFAFDGKY